MLNEVLSCRLLKIPLVMPWDPFLPFCAIFPRTYSLTILPSLILGATFTLNTKNVFFDALSTLISGGNVYADTRTILLYDSFLNIFGANVYNNTRNIFFNDSSLLVSEATFTLTQETYCLTILLTGARFIFLSTKIE